MSVSEICLDADATTLRTVAGHVISRRGVRAAGPKPDRPARRDRTVAALDLAQPYGSRIRHEDEKIPSAILMRILQNRR
jgi:hypothetical protein